VDVPRHYCRGVEHHSRVPARELVVLAVWLFTEQLPTTRLARIEHISSQWILDISSSITMDVTMRFRTTCNVTLGSRRKEGEGCALGDRDELMRWPCALDVIGRLVNKLETLKLPSAREQFQRNRYYKHRFFSTYE
jgi:hypothetical protein